MTSDSKKTFLITGGTGSLGTALTLDLLSQGHKVRVYARNEHGHERLQKLVPAAERSNFSSLLGAVEDSLRLGVACRGVSHVVHAAAQKVIGLAEYNPLECLKTNVGGSANVMRACLDAGVERAVLISTDKAAAPNTLYGASKMCAERLWLAANRYSAGRGTEFVGCRYGNVFGSQGSVIRVWGEQSAVKGQITLTDHEATRFHLTLHDAVRLVEETLSNARAGTLWIPKLPTYKLGDLARAFHRVGDAMMPDIVTGLKPGEKRHEDLISENESSSVEHDPDQGDVIGYRSHYVLEPGKVHQKGGWAFSSGPPDRRLGIDRLEKEIREWASSS